MGRFEQVGYVHVGHGGVHGACHHHVHGIKFMAARHGVLLRTPLSCSCMYLPADLPPPLPSSALPSPPLPSPCAAGMAFFVNDVSLASASVSPLADSLALRLVLEDNGTEIKGVGTLAPGAPPLMPGWLWLQVLSTHSEGKGRRCARRALTA